MKYIPQFCIKYSPRATQEPCALCGTQHQWQLGPEIYIEGTWLLVCPACARQHIPHLYQVLAAAGRYQNAALPPEWEDEETQNFIVR